MTENEIMAIREKRLAETKARIVREEAELLGRDRTTREVSFMLGIQEPALCRWAKNGVVTGTYRTGCVGTGRRSLLTRRGLTLRKRQAERESTLVLKGGRDNE